MTFYTTYSTNSRSFSTSKVQNPPLIRVKENFENTTSLHQVTKFPYTGPQRKAHFNGATLSFRFRSINFDKKRALPFFLALELLTQQKAVATLARRHLLAWKVRKGSLVGCRVTLRNQALLAFLDTLELSVPRIESLIPPSITARRQRRLEQDNTHKNILANRKSQGRRLAANSIELSARSTRRLSAEAFTFGELTLFAPFERGLGLHNDVQRFHFSLNVSSRPFEERLFLFRSVKLPVF
jgi:hypothetical protein